VVACAFVFAINTTLALVLLGGVVLFVGVFVWQVLPTGKLMREANDAFSDLFGNAWDGLQNPRLIKLVGTETKEAEAVYEEFTTNTMPTWMNLYRVWQSLSFMQKMIVLATQIAIILVGAPLVQANTLTVGELIAFNGYANLVYGPFIQLGYQWQSIQNALLDIVKSEEMLATEPENYEGGKADISLREPISFANVSFTYDEDEGEVLSDISFTAKFGQTVALVGESGEGKSTLVDLIPRFIEPSAGEIYIGDTKIRNINLAYLRDNIALVPQRITLFNRTIERNMTCGLEASRQEMIAAAKQVQAHEFITDTYDGYESVVGERGLKFSAGESQRIALARAFLADPAILILDEPTSALDAKNEKLITDVLEDLWQDRTTFIIAHRLSTVHNADTILVLKTDELPNRALTTS
jgi:subfamily B ATP-binding cassette protein MsbA